jgi:hypothetical protein
MPGAAGSCPFPLAAVVKVDQPTQHGTCRGATSPRRQVAAKRRPGFGIR